MPDVAPQTHAAILREIRAVRADVVALRKTSPVQQGYMGFELAETTFADLHEAVNGTRDPALIATFLKRAFAALNTTGGGAVAPALDRARPKFQLIVDTLEPKNA